MRLGYWGVRMLFKIFTILFLLTVICVLTTGDSYAQDFSYNHYFEIVSKLHQLAEEHSSIAKMVELNPLTEGGIPIWAIKISDNVEAKENEQRVLFIGTHHAREWISSEVPRLLADHLVKSYDSDARVKTLIDNVEIWIVAVLNPDGHTFSWVEDQDGEDIHRQWRKNRRDNGLLCDLFENGRGVDLNRNYGSSTWGGTGSSGLCFEDTYRGPDPFSEPETQAIRNLMTDIPFNAVLSYHSYSQLILYPWGYTSDPIAETSDWIYMEEAAREMESLIESVHQMDYTPMQSGNLYRKHAPGVLTDWTYERFGIPSFTIELRPCKGCLYGFELPEEQIQPTWEENWPAAEFLIELFTLQITAPSSTQTVFAGPSDNPRSLRIFLDGVWRGKIPGDFFVKVGGKNANVISVTRFPETPETGLHNAYQLLIQPPIQPGNGRYDLEVALGDASDSVIQGVLYQDQTKVDVIPVIDRSGSMIGQKILDAKIAASQFVDLMQIDDQVGIVSFSSYATTNFPLTLIGPTTKNDAKYQISLINAGGGTSIGDGLQAGYAQFSASGDPSHPWVMILLSDGVSVDIGNVLETLKTAGITVYSIGLGTSINEPLLQQIASETGGKYYFAPTSQELAEIYNEISAFVAGQQVLLSHTDTVQQGSTDTASAVVDSSVSQATFSITWGGSDLDLELETPSGNRIDPAAASADPNIEFLTSPTLEFYRIMSPQPGQWTLYSTAVIADAGGEEYTARVTADSDLLMDLFSDGGDLTGDPIHVIASIADTQPILNAAVTAEIVSPNPNDSATITLFDDGKHEDGFADDGTYGNVFTNTSTSGSYQITAYSSGVSISSDAFERETREIVYVEMRPEITVEVNAPADREVEAGTSGLLDFEIANTGTVFETYKLLTGPPETDLWADVSSIPDTITVGPGLTETVSIPFNVPPIEDFPVANSLVLLAISQTESLVKDSDSVNISVPAADLHTTLTGPKKAAQGTEIEYTIVYGNRGPNDAANIVLAARLPDGVNYLENTLGDVTLQPDGSLAWFLPSLPAGVEGQFNISVSVSSKVKAGTVLSSIVAIASGFTDQGPVGGTPDTNIDDNEAVLETNVTGMVFLPISSR